MNTISGHHATLPYLQISNHVFLNYCFGYFFLNFYPVSPLLLHLHVQSKRLTRRPNAKLFHYIFFYFSFISNIPIEAATATQRPTYLLYNLTCILFNSNFIPIWLLYIILLVTWFFWNDKSIKYGFWTIDTDSPFRTTLPLHFSSIYRRLEMKSGF